jgi:hypothetical protein
MDIAGDKLIDKERGGYMRVEKRDPRENYQHILI